MTGDRVTLRRAGDEDIAFLERLVTHDDVAPYLAAVRASSAEEIAADIARGAEDPDAFGVFVIEVRGVPAGTVTFERVNRRSRIASLSGLALEPAARGRGVADEAIRLLRGYLFEELGFHRLQLEVYAFNERALRQAERSGFVREGVRRRAYWRNEAWVDGVLFGLLQEDLEG